MKFALVPLLTLVASLALQPARAADQPGPPAPQSDADYQPGPDSERQPGVPTGKMFSFNFDSSKVFPGTSHSINVYVPAGYTGEKPACVYIALDGLGFSAPTVFDNLIHKHEMPVTIGIGVSPGQVNSAQAPANPRFNRSLEFDGLNDSLARCVLEEILPEVEKRKTPDGQSILLSKDPNDRCVAGGSTGAIAAFTLAWERPDAFRRVFTAIGTFVGMRGGDRYPVLVRKTEPKPLRVFMQDGSNDEWGGGPEVGDWWMGNQTLERALEFSGYQVNHVWGVGTHSGRHATAIFPDAMRWLWKDWPKPIVAGESQNTFLKAILEPGEDWREINKDGAPMAQICSSPDGKIHGKDSAGGPWQLAADGSLQPLATQAPQATIDETLAFGPNGRWYTSSGFSAEITAHEPGGQSSVLARGLLTMHFIVTHDGNIYATDFEKGEVWLIRPNGEKISLDNHLHDPTGVAISPDGLWLAVAEGKTHWGYSYQIQPDGTVQGRQQFYWFHVPDTADDSGAGDWCVDRDGRLYSATRMGVQVFDRNGRVRAILPVPGGEVASLCFGGVNFDTLYVVSSGRVYARKLKAPGAPAWAAPIKLPPWGAG